MENDYLNFVSRQIKSLKTPEVRDLAWVIAAPPVFESLPDTSVNFLTYDFFKNEFLRILPGLFELDKSPEKLLSFINNGNTRLLGKYFENLIGFWLAEFSRFTLVKSNLQIFQNGRTIGEIDFLIRDENGQIFHLEAAGKYYLSSKGTSEWRDFYGPNPADNLADKLEKMLNGQITLTSNQNARDVLEQLGIKEQPEPLLLFKGFLFYPYQKTGEVKPAKGVSPHHLKGKWVTIQDIDSLRKNSIRWVIPERRSWISRRFQVPYKKTFSFNTLKAKLETYFSDNIYPVLICAGEEEDGAFDETERYFVVPTNYPHSFFI